MTINSFTRQIEILVGRYPERISVLCKNRIYRALLVPVQYSNTTCAERSGYRSDSCAGQYILLSHHAKKTKKYGPIGFGTFSHVSAKGSNRFCKRCKTSAKILGTKKEIEDEIFMDAKMVTDIPYSTPNNSKEKKKQKIERKRSWVLHWCLVFSEQQSNLFLDFLLKSY